MKNQTILKSSLLLALILCSSLVYASEVTGHLSSDGLANGQSTTGTISGTVVSPGGSEVSGSVGGNIIVATVSGGSSSHGGGSSGYRISGSVLGASTVASNVPVGQIGVSSSFSPSGDALESPSRELAVGDPVAATDVEETTDTAQAGTVTNLTPNQTANVASALSGLELSGWSWIIILIILILATLGYIYHRNEKGNWRIGR